MYVMSQLEVTRGVCAAPAVYSLGRQSSDDPEMPPSIKLGITRGGEEKLLS